MPSASPHGKPSVPRLLEPPARRRSIIWLFILLLLGCPLRRGLCARKSSTEVNRIRRRRREIQPTVRDELSSTPSHSTYWPPSPSFPNSFFLTRISSDFPYFSSNWSSFSSWLWPDGWSWSVNTKTSASSRNTTVAPTSSSTTSGADEGKIDYGAYVREHGVVSDVGRRWIARKRLQVEKTTDLPFLQHTSSLRYLKVERILPAPSREAWTQTAFFAL
jgi:hypothetical protein